MARAKRDNTPARWAVALVAGLASVAFWAGIINGPQPAQASNSSTQGAQTASAQLSGQFNQPPASSSSFFQAPVAAPMPRLRTRGS